MPTKKAPKGSKKKAANKPRLRDLSAKEGPKGGLTILNDWIEQARVQKR